MATVKTNQSGNVITKQGLVSCVCCNEGFILECDPTAPGYDEPTWQGSCHTNPSWCVVKKPDDSVVYDGCPDLNFIKTPLLLSQIIQVKYDGSKCGGGHQCDGATFKLYALRGTAKAFMGNVNLNNKVTGANVDGGTFTVTQEILDALELP